VLSVKKIADGFVARSAAPAAAILSLAAALAVSPLAVDAAAFDIDAADDMDDIDDMDDVDF
jgi:hypothetical protein